MTSPPAASRRAQHIALAAAAVTVFLVHFRPWQGGLLEDWGAARDWVTSGGFTGIVREQWPHWVGRPLSVFPMPLSLAISDGGFVGPFLFIALVAVAQMYVAWWALGPLLRSPWLRFGLVVAIGFKPWWEAGLILRFINAQVALLLALVWLGVMIRYARTGRVWWLVGSVLIAIASLLTYQAPAAALCVGAVAIAVTVTPSWPRRVAAVLATVVAVGASFVWTLFIAPLLSPFAYEAGSAGEYVALLRSVRIIGHTLRTEAPSLVVVGAVLVVGVAIAWRQRVIDGVQGLLLLAALAISPLTALTFAVSEFWLQDHERVVQPVGLTLWIVAVCVASVLVIAVRPQQVTAAVLVAGSVVGGVIGYTTWTRFAVMQQELITAVKPFRADLPDNATLVVSDPTGEFGGLYTLLPPHLDVALEEIQGPGASVVLCTVDGVTRDEGVVTPSCGDALAFQTLTELGTIDIENVDAQMELTQVKPLPQDQIFRIVDRTDLQMESNENGTWWWLDSRATTFDISLPDDEPFRTITGAIMANECSPQHVTVTFTSGNETHVQVLTVDASTSESFIIPMSAPVTRATLTVDPGSSPTCTASGDARERTVALLNPGLGR